MTRLGIGGPEELSEGRATLDFSPVPMPLPCHPVPFPDTSTASLPWPLVLGVGKSLLFWTGLFSTVNFSAELLTLPPLCQGKKQMVTGPPGEALTGQREKILLRLLHLLQERLSRGSRARDFGWGTWGPPGLYCPASSGEGGQRFSNRKAYGTEAPPRALCEIAWGFRLPGKSLQS